jgi:polar amino acid transport system substrate-binding protein
MTHLVTFERSVSRKERTMLRKIAACLSVAAASVLLCAGTARAAGSDIKAGSITNSPPMISYASDGTTLQGRAIVFESIPFNALITAMQAKRIDITFTMMNDTPEREKLLDFVDFFNLGTMLLIKKGNPEHVDSLETLCGKTVSTVQGSTQIALVDDASAKCRTQGKPAIENLQYAQPSDARLQVQTGHVAAFLGNTPVMIYLAKTAGDGTIFDVVRDHEYQPVPLGIGVDKSNTELRDALKKALDTLIGDGTYRKILEKHGVETGAVKSATINGGANVKI